MYGTRADVLVDFVLTVNLFAPVGMVLAIRAAKNHSYTRHRAMQLGLFSLCVLAVCLLEVKIRVGGGSGSLVAGSPYAGTALMKGVLLGHVSGALVSYALWGWLVVASWRRFKTALPGGFSARHRMMGRVVFGLLLVDAATASAMYWFGFAAT